LKDVFHFVSKSTLKRNAYEVLVAKPEGKRLLGRWCVWRAMSKWILKENGRAHIYFI
jgi:hypothetical protein